MAEETNEAYLYASVGYGIATLIILLNLIYLIRRYRESKNKNVLQLCVSNVFYLTGYSIGSVTDYMATDASDWTIEQLAPFRFSVAGIALLGLAIMGHVIINRLHVFDIASRNVARFLQTLNIAFVLIIAGFSIVAFFVPLPVYIMVYKIVTYVFLGFSVTSTFTINILVAHKTRHVIRRVRVFFSTTAGSDKALTSYAKRLFISMCCSFAADWLALAFYALRSFVPGPFNLVWTIFGAIHVGGETSFQRNLRLFVEQHERIFISSAHPQIVPDQTHMAGIAATDEPDKNKLAPTEKASRVASSAEATDEKFE